MSKFRKIVEKAIFDVRFDHENVKQGNSFASEKTSKIYKELLDLKTITNLVEFGSVSIDIVNICVVIALSDKNKIGYSLSDKKVYIFVTTPLDLIDIIQPISIFHELIHYYHDVILKADMTDVYRGETETEQEKIMYYNSIEELSTYYNELIVYMSKLFYSLYKEAEIHNERINKEKILNDWLVKLYLSINTNPKYGYNKVFKYISPENKKMIFDKLVDYFDKNLTESVTYTHRAKIEELIKQLEMNPEVQKRWEEARKESDKIMHSPGWRTHFKESLVENELTIQEIYQDLNKGK